MADIELFGQVGPNTIGDGPTNPMRPRQGRTGELVVTEVHGKYYEPAKRGKLFIATTPAAGVLVPIFTNATQQFGIYNPSNSGIDINLLKTYVGYVSGTMVAGHLCYAMLQNVAAPGTVTAAILNGARPVGGASAALGLYYSPLTPAIQPVAAQYYRPLGISQVVQAATATNAPWTAVDDVDGSIIVPPGNVLLIAANVAAALQATIACLVEEVPVGAS